MLISQHKHQPSCLSQIFSLSECFGSKWMYKEWLLRCTQRHLLCSMWHPKATCVFADNAKHSHVRIDPLWDFLKLYLNTFLLPSTFDGFSNQMITWFFWVPINSTASMCVFHLPICFDLHHCYFSALASVSLSYFADSLAVAQNSLSSSLMLTSEQDQNSGGEDSQLMLHYSSVLPHNKTKISHTLTWQLKLWSLFTIFNNRRLMKIRLLKFWLQTNQPTPNKQTKNPTPNNNKKPPTTQQ